MAPGAFVGANVYPYIGYRAECLCGWKGRPHDTEHDARGERDRHVNGCLTYAKAREDASTQGDD